MLFDYHILLVHGPISQAFSVLASKGRSKIPSATNFSMEYDMLFLIRDNDKEISVQQVPNKHYVRMARVAHTSTTRNSDGSTVRIYHTR